MCHQQSSCDFAQVNIDFESEQDMVEKARVGLALQPVATALFANSPFRDGKPTGGLGWAVLCLCCAVQWERPAVHCVVLHSWCMLCNAGL